RQMQNRKLEPGKGKDKQKKRETDRAQKYAPERAIEEIRDGPSKACEHDGAPLIERKPAEACVSKPFDVTAIGSAIVDVIAVVDDQFLLSHSIAKGVMSLVDEYRAQTLHNALPNPREIAGGSAANTMAGLASLGARGAFIGKVKADRLGQALAGGVAGRGLPAPTHDGQEGRGKAF